MKIYLTLLNFNCKICILNAISTVDISKHAITGFILEKVKSVVDVQYYIEFTTLNLPT